MTDCWLVSQHQKPPPAGADFDACLCRFTERSGGLEAAPGQIWLAWSPSASGPKLADHAKPSLPLIPHAFHRNSALVSVGFCPGRNQAFLMPDLRWAVRPDLIMTFPPHYAAALPYIALFFLVPASWLVRLKTCEPFGTLAFKHACMPKNCLAGW